MIKHDIQYATLQAGSGPGNAALGVTSLAYPLTPAHAEPHVAAPAIRPMPPQIGAAVSTLLLIAALCVTAAELVYRAVPRRR